MPHVYLTLRRLALAATQLSGLFNGEVKVDLHQSGVVIELTRYGVRRQQDQRWTGRLIKDWPILEQTPPDVLWRALGYEILKLWQEVDLENPGKAAALLDQVGRWSPSENAGRAHAIDADRPA